jgi:hypothetical protein
MNRPHRKRARLGAILLAAAGLIAMLAFPGLAAAKQRDRNHDGIPDRWEKRHHLSLKVKQTRRDQDHDQLANQAEFQATDNPRDPDSDNDGVEDGDENAGTIQSFDSATGRLVINLFNGDTVAGTVTEQTEIECENESEQAGTASASDDGGEEANDETAGEDNVNSGDDANDANDAVDDNGSDNPEAGDEGDDNAAASCTAADLVAGAVVEEAELSLEEGAATFKEVELAS